MEMQITEKSFILNGQAYPFAAIGYILYQADQHRATVGLNDPGHDEAVTIQTLHTSALMLAYSRWAFNRT